MVHSGAYDRIIAGEYPTREQPQSVRAEAGDAVAHYTERFRDTFRELGDTIESGGAQLSDWLRNTRGRREEPAE